MEFPLLFSLRNKNFHKWSIKVTQECEIVRTYGPEFGPQTTSVHKIVVGTNETTPYQQACADAMSMFRKQTVEGYSETRSNKPFLPLPMLSYFFDKNSSLIMYPAFVQPMLTGVRMITTFDENDQFLFLNRTGKSFETDNIEKHLDFLKTVSLWLDGELFSNSEYHVYDIIPKNDIHMSFHERHDALRHLSKKFPDKIKWVPTYVVQNADEVIRHHNDFVQQGYEGVMIRNRDGPYVHRRSYDLQKYKNFIDDEFVIVDVKEATDAGTAILQCKTNDGSCFWVRSKGTKEYHAQLLRDKEHILYKRLTVRYQNMTDKNIPRFPLGIVIREYN